MASAYDGLLIGGRRIACAACFAVAITIALAATALAQDAGVSGIPPGPANINGPNNTGRDPSGIGNAGRVAPLPQPSITPVTPPTAVPLSSARPSVRSSSRVRLVTPHASHLSPRARRIAEEARVKENDRLLKHGVTSICRGC